MAAYVALLRGINVGGKRSLPMTKVREAFEAGGASNVATYIQSGNVVFTAKSINAAPLSEALARVAGFTVPVVLRTRAEWSAVIAACPWTTDTVHCAFAPAKLAPAVLGKLAAIDRQTFAPSRFVQNGKEIYFDLPNGIGNDKLAGTVLRHAGDVTTRNWRTVLKLQELVAAL
jgi:uncharacterized protein (DUF1697 family)